MLGATWAAGVAALLFAVDDARCDRRVPGQPERPRGCDVRRLGDDRADRWRRDGSRPAALLAPLLLMAALFSKEEGIGTCRLPGRLLAVRRPRGAVARLPGLWPYAAAVIAWGTLRSSWGYCVRDVGLYIDPLTDTGRFLAGRSGPPPDPPARPVEPDPGGSRRRPTTTGPRLLVVVRGGIPGAGPFRDDPAPSPRSTRTLLGRAEFDGSHSIVQGGRHGGRVDRCVGIDHVRRHWLSLSGLRSGWESP